MKSENFVKSFKRFTAAVALGCLLFVTTPGVQPASPPEPEAVAFVLPLPAKDAAGLIPGGFVPQGNYWSG